MAGEESEAVAGGSARGADGAKPCGANLTSSFQTIGTVTNGSNLLQMPGGTTGFYRLKQSD